MGANERAIKAFNAMKDMGISEKRVKPVLKNLLRLYDKNWELIEDNHYTALIEAIFEQEKEEEATTKNEEEQLCEESAGPPLNKMRLRGNSDATSTSGDLTLTRSNIDVDEEEQLCEKSAGPPLKKMRSRGKGKGDAASASGDLTLTRSNIDVDEEEQLCEESAGPPLKKMRWGKSDAASAPGDLTLTRSNIDVDDLPIAQSIEHDPLLSQVKDKDVQEALSLPLALFRPDEEEQSQLCLRDRSKHHHISPQSHSRDNAKDPVLLSSVCCGEKISQSHTLTGHLRHSFAARFKEPNVDPGIIISPKKKMPDSRQSNDFVMPKSKPLGDYSPFEVPIAVMPPINSEKTVGIDQFVEDGHSTLNGSTVQVNGVKSLASKDNHIVNSDRPSEAVMSSEFATIPEMPMSFVIASSPLAEVKISLSCAQSYERPGVHVPSLDEVLKAAEDKCVRSYRILDPNFSIMKVYQEICRSFLDLSSQQNRVQLPTKFSDGSSNGQSSPKAVLPGPPRVLLFDGIESYNNPLSDGNLNDGRAMEEQLNSINSDSLVAVSRQGFAVDSVRPLHDLNDISKGQERVRISVINEVSSEPYPSSFYYIRRNTVYQSAYLNFSLARIGDDCCLNCFGDCLSSSIPCACARDAGGDFAYTLDGLVKEEFLKECISMNRDPRRQQRYFCCKQCPKEGLSNPCKGHLVRRFIKECWSKCGCNKQCGNRVVQRGISCNLQVFFTSEGKGWGVRSLQDLPKGTFVCEYVGEVLTCTEIYERNMHSTGNEKYTYPVLLDAAAWGLKGDLKDEEALCLDGKYYGNVARFINHRCFDANLVEIPVKIENQDRHYYHLALFTTRDVDALEELTWDYGINFDDDHPTVKAFRCCCKSNYCRDLKRYSRVTQKSGCIT